MKGWSVSGFWLLLAGLAAVGCESTGALGDQTDAVAELAPVAVEVAEVRAGTFSEDLEVVGSLSPKFEAQVKSEYQGIIAEVYVNEWVRVEKDQPLARLDTSEIDVLLQRAMAQVEAIRAQLLKAEVSVNRANREYERAQQLREFGLATQQNLDDALTAKEAAEAEIKAVNAQIRAAEEDVRQAATRRSKAVLRAPMNGIVSESRPNVGDLVGDPTNSQPSFRIVDNRLLELVLDIPSSKLPLVRIGLPLTFTTEAIPGREFKGRISFINPVADAGSRSVRVIAEVRNNAEELRPGLFVKATILTGRTSESLEVPRVALLTWDTESNRAEVFLVEQETARRTSVQLGRVEKDRVEVLSGLVAGDRVITRGGFNVRNGDPVKVVQEGGA